MSVLRQIARPVTAALVLALALSACGKRGSPVAPSDAKEEERPAAAVQN